MPEEDEDPWKEIVTERDEVPEKDDDPQEELAISSDEVPEKDEIHVGELPSNILAEKTHSKEDTEFRDAISREQTSLAYTLSKKDDD